MDFFHVDIIKQNADPPRILLPLQVVKSYFGKDKNFKPPTVFFITRVKSAGLGNRNFNHCDIFRWAEKKRSISKARVNKIENFVRLIAHICLRSPGVLSLFYASLFPLFFFCSPSHTHAHTLARRVNLSPADVTEISNSGVRAAGARFWKLLVPAFGRWLLVWHLFLDGYFAHLGKCVRTVFEKIIRGRLDKRVIPF